MPGPLFCEGETVELRPVEEEDVEFLQKLVNDPRVRAGIGASEPINRTEEAEWIDSISESDEIHLLFCLDGTRLGILGMHPEHDTWDNAEVGYMLTPEEWDKGYTTDALERFCQYCFEERAMHKLWAKAYETNPASRRVLEKVGFQEEGIFRKEAFVGGEYVDIHRYGLLAAEFGNG